MRGRIDRRVFYTFILLNAIEVSIDRFNWRKIRCQALVK